MNLINSVTSGMNFNFGSNFFNKILLESEINLMFKYIYKNHGK